MKNVCLNFTLLPSSDYSLFILNKVLMLLCIQIALMLSRTSGVNKLFTIQESISIQYGIQCNKHKQPLTMSLTKKHTVLLSVPQFFKMLNHQNTAGDCLEVTFAPSVSVIQENYGPDRPHIV